MKSREHTRKTSKDASKHGHTIEIFEKGAIKKRKYAIQRMGANWWAGDKQKRPSEETWQEKRYATKSKGARWRAVSTQTILLEKRASTKRYVD